MSMGSVVALVRPPEEFFPAVASLRSRSSWSYRCFNSASTLVRDDLGHGCVVGSVRFGQSVGGGIGCVGDSQATSVSLEAA